MDSQFVEGSYLFPDALKAYRRCTRLMRQGEGPQQKKDIKVGGRQQCSQLARPPSRPPVAWPGGHST